MLQNFPHRSCLPLPAKMHGGAWGGAAAADCQLREDESFTLRRSSFPVAGPAPQNCPPRWLNSYGVHLPDCSRFIRCDCHLQIYCGVSGECAALARGKSSMDKSAEYLSKAQYYWEKAEQTTAYERQCWLMIASGYLRLHEESRQKQSAERPGTQVQPTEERPKGELQPHGDGSSVDFCQFSVVDRQLRSTSQSAPQQSARQAVRRNFPLIRRF